MINYFKKKQSYAHVTKSPHLFILKATLYFILGIFSNIILNKKNEEYFSSAFAICWFFRPCRRRHVVSHVSRPVESARHGENGPSAHIGRNL